MGHHGTIAPPEGMKVSVMCYRRRDIIPAYHIVHIPSSIINHIIIRAVSMVHSSSETSDSDGIQNITSLSARIECALNLIGVNRSLHHPVTFIFLLTPFLTISTPHQSSIFHRNLRTRFHKPKFINTNSSALQLSCVELR